MGRRFNNKAPKDAATIRRARAIKLRVEGNTYQQIADKLECSLYTAHTDVQAVLQERREQAAEDADQVRDVELERLDLGIALVVKQIGKGNLAAVDRLVKLTERRCKMLGLDAPERKLLGYDGEHSPADVAKIVRDKFGTVGPGNGHDEAEGPEGS
jgi:hypothetical protein